MGLTLRSSCNIVIYWIMAVTFDKYRIVEVVGTVSVGLLLSSISSTDPLSPSFLSLPLVFSTQPHLLRLDLYPSSVRYLWHGETHRLLSVSQHLPLPFLFPTFSLPLSPSISHYGVWCPLAVCHYTEEWKRLIFHTKALPQLISDQLHPADKENRLCFLGLQKIKVPKNGSSKKKENV